jgi:hypothetical protein
VGHEIVDHRPAVDPDRHCRLLHIKQPPSPQQIVVMLRDIASEVYTAMRDTAQGHRIPRRDRTA